MELYHLSDGIFDLTTMTDEEYELLMSMKWAAWSLNDSSCWIGGFLKNYCITTQGWLFADKSPNLCMGPVVCIPYFRKKISLRDVHLPPLRTGFIQDRF